MRIGVDFDNTIVCCDDLFHRAALDKKLIPTTVGTSKSEVRDYLRGAGQEPAWTELQGYVYGELLRDAEPFPGVVGFFQTCALKKVPVCIVSHKTKKPFLGKPYDLHKTANEWLTSRDFFSKGALPVEQVYFELTKEKKLERISKSGCTHFIDDLPEFLAEATFPPNVKKFLFDPNRHAEPAGDVTRVSSWPDMENFLWTH